MTTERSSDAHRIEFTYFSQEDLLQAGCLDFRLAIDAAEAAMLAHRRGEVIFPEKIVQIFNEDTQERINCLPATLKAEAYLRREMGFGLSAERRALRHAESDGLVRACRRSKRVSRGRSGRHAGLQHARGRDGRHRRQAPGARQTRR